MGHAGGRFIGLAEFDLLYDLTNLQNPFLLFVLIGQIPILLGILTGNIKRYYVLTGIGVAILNIIALLILCFDLITNPKVALTGIPFLFMTTTFIYRYIKENESKIFSRTLNK